MKKYFLLMLMIMLAACSCNNRSGGVLIWSNEPEEEEPLKKIGLVLGGGGAKAAAEVGVLKIIDSLGIHFDYIAGSSMGAIVGGLYAYGYSAADIEKIFLEEDWVSLHYPKSLFSSVDDGRDRFGKVPGDTIESRLNEKFNECLMENTRIPFLCTATNITDKKNLKGEVLTEGNLARNIRASMSWPAPLVGYNAVYIKGKDLVDGGMWNNLPVDLIKDSVDVVIVIDLEQEQYNDHSEGEMNLTGYAAEVLDAKGFGDLLGLKWLLEWLKDNPSWKTKHNDNVREAKEGENIYIKPKLDGYTILSFKKEKIDSMIRLGEIAARRQIERLEQLK